MPFSAMLLCIPCLFPPPFLLSPPAQPLSLSLLLSHTNCACSQSDRLMTPTLGGGPKTWILSVRDQQSPGHSIRLIRALRCGRWNCDQSVCPVTLTALVLQMKKEIHVFVLSSFLWCMSLSAHHVLSPGESPLVKSIYRLLYNIKRNAKTKLFIQTTSQHVIFVKLDSNHSFMRSTFEKQLNLNILTQFYECLPNPLNLKSLVQLVPQI